MSTDGTLLQCYNRSCGQQFDPERNTPESCVHHPGVPVFHDVYKKWSCCEKKTTDFTEFLNIKGCTKSYHSNIKPPEPPKPAKEKCEEEVVQIRKPLEQKVVIERPDVNQSMIQLPFTIGSSLKPVLEKIELEITLDKGEENGTEIKLNTPCYNKGCKKVYQGEQSNSETCVYHNGVPIFHEGMKFWSCCVKRTTDFDSFLEQVGCTVGKHKWTKEKNDQNLTECRYDWHQTGNSVIVSVYSKCPLPDLSFVEANPVKLHIHIVFGKEKNIFDKELVLFGIIDLQACNVTYLGSKVEIKLKKVELVAWRNITFNEKLMDLQNMSIQDQ